MKDENSPTVHKGGRPKETDEPCKPRYVTLDDSTVKILKKIGAGNVSFGIREVVRRVMALKKAGV